MHVGLAWAVAGLIAVPAAPAAAQLPSPPAPSPYVGVLLPRVTRQIKPTYPPAARNARIQGRVVLECVVLEDGSPVDVRVAESLDPDLDREAITALRQWRFKPGTRDGKAVPVTVQVEFTFTLRGHSGTQALFPVPPVSPAGPTVGAGPSALVVYSPGDGVTLPVTVREVRAHYEHGAHRDKVEGSVTLECVVLPDGTVGDVRVARSLDPRLDDEAVRAVRQWVFKPGTRNGEAVAVRVSIEMSFTMRWR